MKYVGAHNFRRVLNKGRAAKPAYANKSTTEKDSTEGIPNLSWTDCRSYKKHQMSRRPSKSEGRYRRLTRYNFLRDVDGYRKPGGAAYHYPQG